MVRREDALSVPDSLPLTTAQPGIFTKDLSGSGQGIVVKSDMLTLAEPRTLAPRNEVIVLDATGLGPVTPGDQVPAIVTVAGQPSPPVTIAVR
jgi:uncharacterized protein (TIGR03437 family)